MSHTETSKGGESLSKPDRNFEFIGDGRDIKCKLPFLIETNKIDLSQVWNLQTIKDCYHLFIDLKLKLK